MKNIFDYNENINVITTPNGDKVITMNQAIFDTIVNHLYDAAKLQEQEGHNATSEDTKKLWETLLEKEQGK